MLRRWQKIFGCILKSAHYVSKRTSSGIFSWGLRTYFVDFELLAKTFRRVCHNCILWDRRIVLREKSSFKERSYFPIVFGLRAKLLWTFGPTFFGRVVKTAFYVAIETFFSEEKFFLKSSWISLIIFQFWVETFSNALEKISAGLSNLPSISLDEVFEKNNVLMTENFFCLFQNLSEKSSAVRKTFLAADLNCIIHIQRIFFRKFFLRFGDPCWHFWTFRKKIWRF